MADGKTYHVALREDGKWQVKAAKAEKALKIFATQKEAIDYAKKVAASTGGNVLIHKVSGGFRKNKY